MKGQISTELLVIVALVLLIFIPLLVLVYFKANEANQEIGSYQSELAVFRIASLANSVGSLGTNTSIETDVFVPKNVQYLKTVRGVQGGEVVMKVDTPDGASEIVELVRYPIANPGTLADTSTAGGWMRVKISSEYSTTEGAIIRIEKVTSSSP